MQFWYAILLIGNKYRFLDMQFLWYVFFSLIYNFNDKFFHWYALSLICKMIRDMGYGEILQYGCNLRGTDVWSASERATLGSVLIDKTFCIPDFRSLSGRLSLIESKRNEFSAQSITYPTISPSDNYSINWLTQSADYFISWLLDFSISW